MNTWILILVFFTGWEVDAITYIPMATENLCRSVQSDAVRDYELKTEGQKEPRNRLKGICIER